VKCGDNFPVVSNSVLAPVKTSFDIKPNQSNGTIYGQVLGNDQILCGPCSFNSVARQADEGLENGAPAHSAVFHAHATGLPQLATN
jgi:hypothetical protein